jgi:hypothetical protein
MKLQRNRLLQLGLFLVLTGIITACTSNENRSTAEQTSQTTQIQVDTTGYWKYKGELTLLLGAFNHGHNPFIDGSTIDDIDIDSMDVIISQIQEMVDAGGNTLRCVLDPGWATFRGIESYHRNSEGKYDLSKPEGPYWERLATFIAEAEKRDVIVELEIWDRFDWFDDGWEANPFNPKNNINYTYENTNLKNAYERGEIYFNHPMTLGIPGRPRYDTVSPEKKEKYDIVREYQEIFVSKVYDVAKYHGNVLYNMNNETAEHTAWGEYWIEHLKNKADNDGIEIICTNMQDGLFELEESKELAHQLMHPEIYDYLDISQINSRLRDETHWEAVKYIADRAKQQGFLLHMTKLYGNDGRLPDPWSGWKPGDSDNAIEEWWRNLIAGVAGVRFHRPLSGIGLSDKAKACILATRMVEEQAKFWEVDSRLDLLSQREADEAYLAADPGEKYILYFTHQGGGSVGLDMKDYGADQFNVSWINIDKGTLHAQDIISGGEVVNINRPDSNAHWVAVIIQAE